MWTPAALASEITAYDGVVWRVVETQYKAATMQLTDTLEEQRILEMILEESKPPIPRDCQGLDFLLSTPFRYVPYPIGSRFRRAHQSEGVFYAAEVVEAAIAESAFYTLLFYTESPQTELPGALEYTAFNVRCRTARSIDLTKPSLNRDATLWTHPLDYGPCHDLADAARQSEVDVIRYQSVRDPEHRANIAILACRAFAAAKIGGHQTWHVNVQRTAVRAWCESPAVQLEFPQGAFADPRLPI